MSITEKLLKNSTIKSTTTLDKSAVFNLSEPTTTPIPILNLALSGKLTGGLYSGLTQFAGPSKHFKSNLALICVAAYLKKYPEGACIFYDSEGGSKESYFKSFGIDSSRVVHTAIKNVEQLKFDVMAQVTEISKGDKIIIVIDSIGNLASKKEVEDALEKNSAADMSRAKAMKSLFRIVTPELNERDIPMVVINHSYTEQKMYGREVVSGGTGAMYSSNDVIILGRSQEKDDEGLSGYTFTMNTEKSRTVKEKSKFPFTVKFEGGIERFSGLMELALETGHVTKPKNGWYTRPMVDGDKNFRMDETKNFSFWEPILKSDFPKVLENKFKLNENGMLLDE
jgi:RecA/RadA recombinase